MAVASYLVLRMMYIGNVLSLGSYTYSSIGTDQQSINDEQRRRIVIGIWTLAGLERGWLYLNQFDPANLAHILKHISLFLIIRPPLTALFEVTVLLAYSRTYSPLRQKKSLGRYSGIIDFGEIRGTDSLYDLGHFRMRDGETLPTLVLPYLVEGYREVAYLPPDYEQRISLSSLLIAINTLARTMNRSPENVHDHQGLKSIRRDIQVLLT